MDASMIFSKLEPGMCCQQQILMVQDEDEKIYFHSKGSVCLEFLTQGCGCSVTKYIQDCYLWAIKGIEHQCPNVVLRLVIVLKGRVDMRG